MCTNVIDGRIAYRIVNDSGKFPRMKNVLKTIRNDISGESQSRICTLNSNQSSVSLSFILSVNSLSVIFDAVDSTIDCRRDQTCCEFSPYCWISFGNIVLYSIHFFFHFNSRKISIRVVIVSPSSSCLSIISLSYVYVNSNKLFFRVSLLIVLFCTYTCWVSIFIWLYELKIKIINKSTLCVEFGGIFFSLLWKSRCVFSR